MIGGFDTHFDDTVRCPRVCFGQAGAMRFAQPSVIKCGGVAECCRIAQLTEAATASSSCSVSTIPWSFCPGPGYLATLHIASVIAANDGKVMVEQIFAEYKDSLFPI